MHTKTMRDSDGDFNEWQTAQTRSCRKCGSLKVQYREWESSCGGWEDYQFRCQQCGHTWWVDGADS